MEKCGVDVHHANVHRCSPLSDFAGCACRTRIASILTGHGARPRQENGQQSNNNNEDRKRQIP